MEHIVIIGNGIVGVTLASYSKKSDSKLLLYLLKLSFLSRTALMYVFMGHMKFEHTQSYGKKTNLVQGFCYNVVRNQRKC
jgi:hypothetical protein